MPLSPLHYQHEKLKAVFFDFHGWTMPLHYGSQIDEHKQVRQDAGVFDVSHMLTIELSGSDTYRLLEKLLSRNIARCHLGKGLYALLLNEQGGVIDDVIVYKLAINRFWVVVNAGNRTVCIYWFKQHAATFTDCRVEPLASHGILAVQGPRAITKFSQAVPEIHYLRNLPPFYCNQYDEILVTRTGYTGESGIEIIAPIAKLVEIWESLLGSGVMPIGLGARDSLRIEAGLPLYGLEMDQNTHVFDTGLRLFVDLDKDRVFIGKSALLAYETLPESRKQAAIALYTKDKGIPRSGCSLSLGSETVGKITSGCYSPILGYAIAMGRVASDKLDALQNTNSLLVVVSSKRRLEAKLTSLPFVAKTNR